MVNFSPFFSYLDDDPMTEIVNQDNDLLSSCLPQCEKDYVQSLRQISIAIRNATNESIAQSNCYRWPTITPYFGSLLSNCKFNSVPFKRK